MISSLRKTPLTIFLFLVIANVYAVDAKMLEKVLQTSKDKMTFVGKIDVSENVSHHEYPLIFISGKSSIYVVTDEQKTATKIGIQVDLEHHLDYHKWSNAPFAGIEKKAYSIKIADEKAFQEYAIIGNYDPLTKKERKKLTDSGYKLANNYAVAAYALVHGIEDGKKTYIIYAETTNKKLSYTLSKESYSEKEREWLNNFEQKFIQNSGLGQLFSEALTRQPGRRIFSRTEKTGFAGFGHRLLCADHTKC